MFSSGFPRELGGDIAERIASGGRREGGETGSEPEARYRLLAENSTDVISVADPGGVIRYTSPACRALSGYEPEEVIGRSGYEFIHPDDLAGVISAHEGVLEQDEFFTSPPYRTRRKDGTYVWIESTVRPIRDPGTGEVVEVQSAARDITARVQAEAKLRARERQLAEAQELAHFGSWERDMETGASFWSDELYRILGFAPGEFEPTWQAYMERVLPEERKQVEQLQARVVAEPQMFHYECQIERPDGEVRVVDSYGDFELDDSGKPLKMRGTAQDITERKRAEEELHRVHTELEKRSNELERSNLELEQFAYDASHDLGEPLRIMSRLARTLAEEYGDSIDDDARLLITSIVDGTERMRLLISDLLEYSRVAREPFERAWVETGAAFEEAVELLAESIAEKDATVTTGHMPGIEAHPTQFRQLLQNLLSNALKFAGEERLRIHVAAERDDSCWSFSVADNGLGIDPQQADRVFELFRRLNTSDAFAGTGIGLSICKRIVDRHGGRIWVEPGEGGGSVFRFTIPDRAIGLEAVLKGQLDPA